MVEILSLEDLRELNSNVPELHFKGHTSPTNANSPTKPKRCLAQDSSLNEPPRRISPFKGSKSSMTAQELFSTTPKRLPRAKTQSVDRDLYGSCKPKPSNTEIRFRDLQNMAGSRTVTQTPSRMIMGRKYISSEQPVSRTKRQHEDSRCDQNINLNLLDKFKEHEKLKPCLRSQLKPVQLTENETAETENDITTTLNTIRNAENAKNVKAFLQPKLEETQPRKKRRAVTFTTELGDIDESSQGVQDTNKLLLKILENQEFIIRRLTVIEQKLQL